MKNLVYILILLFTISACNKEKKTTNHTTKAIVLEVEYINFAWGFQHTSSLIDTNGVIHSYNNTNYDNKSWVFPDSLGYISETDLQHNYNLTNLASETINLDTIKQAVTLISGVETNNLSIKTNVGADMGETNYYAYIFDETANKYKKLFLAKCGDTYQLNNNANAQSILHLVWKNRSYCF